MNRRDSGGGLNTDPEFNFEQDRLKVDHHRHGQPVPEKKPRKNEIR